MDLSSCNRLLQVPAVPMGFGHMTCYSTHHMTQTLTLGGSLYPWHSLVMLAASACLILMEPGPVPLSNTVILNMIAKILHSPQKHKALCTSPKSVGKTKTCLTSRMSCWTCECISLLVWCCCSPCHQYYVGVPVVFITMSGCLSTSQPYMIITQ